MTAADERHQERDVVTREKEQHRCPEDEDAIRRETIDVATNTITCNDQTSTPLVRWLPLVGAYPSRRAAAEAIKGEQVSVDGKVCTILSHPICGEETVFCQGKMVVAPPHTTIISGVEGRQQGSLPKHTHLILHKPQGCLCTRNNLRQIKGGGKVPDERPTVYDIVAQQLRQCDSTTCHDQTHYVPVGRLDVDTTGLLLLTTDGLLNQNLANPAYKVDKVYRAVLRDTTKPLSNDAIQKLADGVLMRPGGGKPEVLVKGEACNVTGETGTVDLRITGGYFHQVKHMMRLVGRPLSKLHRWKFANLTLNTKLLSEGQCRHLTDVEVHNLYALAKERLQRAQKEEGERIGSVFHP